MNRRGARSGQLLLVALALSLLASLLLMSPGPAAATPPDDEPPLPSRTPTTIDNDFIPEDRNISDCIGALQRPGCGSESRGGWRQTLTFAVMALGLVLVFGRIAWSVRRKQRAAAASDDGPAAQT